MDITKPDWRNRYNAALAALGYDPTVFEAKLHPSIEKFFLGEVKLFDDSLGDFPKNHPKLEKQVQDIKARIADPFVDTTCLEKLNLALLRKRVTGGEEQLRRMEELVLGVPYIPPNTQELMILQRQLHQNWQEMLREVEEKFSGYKRFTERIMNAIVKEATGRSVLSPYYDPFQDERNRNDFYRAKVPQEKSWMIGWGARCLAKILKLIAEENDWRRFLYVTSPELHEIAAEVKMSVTFPQPLGEDKVSAKVAYEAVLPKEPTPGEQRELEQKVEEHFKKRVERIYASAA